MNALAAALTKLPRALNYRAGAVAIAAAPENRR
jgi:hypothetical protein